MSEARRAVCAIAATAFALLLLFTLIQYGGHVTRAVSCLVALLGVLSQFSAQDDEAQPFHRWVSLLGFSAALWAIIMFVLGY